jgi:hypothetical protein
MPTILPASAYRELSRWFPTVSDRARALGRSRETLTGWERELLDCTVKPSTARRITCVASVTGDVEELIGDARGAGRWMLTPQPLLRGKTPVEMIGVGRLDELSGVIYPGGRITPRRTVRRASSAPQGVVSFPRRRERERSADEAAVLRRIGEDEALIGPVEPARPTHDRRSSSPSSV